MSSVTGKRVFALVLVVVAGVAYLLWRSAPPTIEATPTQVETVPAAQPNAATGAVEPTIKYPVPAAPADDQTLVVPTAPATAAPDLETSDSVVGEALDSLLGKGGLAELVIVKDIVRRIVATVDNLPGEQMPWARSPVRRAEGGFVVDARDGAMTVAAENAARYLPYVQLAEVVDSGRLVALYSRLYPLFQAAYDELGYPNAYFNDRLVVVIDHMLAAPEIEGPIRLVQPKVRYRFEDPALEKLSAGHKIMLRMGTENARRVKARLRELRQRLTAAAPPRG
ncbi:DUF3014 domain-containing protein [Azoarcus sp. L1K30]|uniref:DUF3014 domain-containing protein n=1 Tax=Azoarcus sp. L1K30 TaxID=2820277 RepID=UPI001B812879|nr:DUF3014 domain-containing protein [Azoarcus sp. L1K30]